MRKSAVRRPVMALAMLLGALLLPLSSVLWVPGGVVGDLVRRRWRMPIVRLLAFLTCWAWLEMCGIVAAIVLWATRRTHRIDLFYRIQEWWCRSVVRSLSVCVGMKFTIDGADNLGDGPFVVLARHVSLADAVMSSWVIGTLMKKNPRYVLKNELKMDPCLDIFGHLLPNYFVDRQSSNVSIELQGIQQMATNLGVNDAAVIFPEGSRANDVKRSRALAALAERSPIRYERLQNLRHLLPPKPAGASALLQSVAGAHVITIAHSGLEGLDSLSAILKNFGKHVVQVRVSLKWHERSTVPSGEAFVAWLDEQWIRMDAIVHSQINASAQ